jgi:hypothetical protein
LFPDHDWFPFVNGEWFNIETLQGCFAQSRKHQASRRVYPGASVGTNTRMKRRDKPGGSLISSRSQAEPGNEYGSL